MTNFFSYAISGKVFTFAKAHKVISAVIAVAVVGGGYWAYKTLASSDGEIRYVLSTVQK